MDIWNLCYLDPIIHLYCEFRNRCSWRLAVLPCPPCSHNTRERVRHPDHTTLKDVLLCDEIHTHPSPHHVEYGGRVRARQVQEYLLALGRLLCVERAASALERQQPLLEHRVSQLKEPFGRNDWPDELPVELIRTFYMQCSRIIIKRIQAVTSSSRIGL